MLGLLGISVCEDPTGMPLPERMKNPRVWPLFPVNGRHAAPDHRSDAARELLLDVLKSFDFHVDLDSPPNAAVEPPRDDVSSAQQAHNEMARLLRAGVDV
jgi:hypothetical protein